MIKTCSTCKIEKQVTEFAAYGKSKDGFRGQCRQCRALYVQSWKEKNIEAVRATSRRYASRNRDKRSAYIRQFRTGFTDEIFKKKLAEQNGLCAICKVALDSLPTKAVHADHDHKTGKTRGVLCRDCNRGLGGFADSVDILYAAAAYLQHYKNANELEKE